MRFVKNIKDYHKTSREVLQEAIEGSWMLFSLDNRRFKGDIIPLQVSTGTSQRKAMSSFLLSQNADRKLCS